MLIPAAIMGGAALVGAYANYRSSREQMHAQNHQNKLAAGQAERNERLQREYAQNSLRWKVNDAKMAGVHPTYALGASGTSYTPSATIGGGIADTGKWDAIGSLAEGGQNIGRAFMAQKSPEEKAYTALSLENMQIDNEMKKIELQRLQLGSPGGPGDSFIPGQANSGPVAQKPSELVMSEKNRPGVQAGAINDVQFFYNSDGTLGIVPSQQMKERTEDDFISELLWHGRNRLNPPAPQVKDYPLPKGFKEKGYKYWMWNHMRQRFQPSKNP